MDQQCGGVDGDTGGIGALLLEQQRSAYALKAVVVGERHQKVAHITGLAGNNYVS